MDNVRILIIEDSLTQALRLQDSLEKHQYETQIANNGKTGLDLLKQKHFTLVISDIIMPEMDGYELCRQIKSDNRLKDVPVILLTSLSDPHDVIEALECGADNFVTKPYNEKFLVSRIQNILINRELRLSGMSEMGIEIVFAGKNILLHPVVCKLWISYFQHMKMPFRKTRSWSRSTGNW
ncbi:MAG: Response regulator receiver sensor signal transduction histidine kinase [Candidatus Magnetoglobus multicellularis str. Araruama]|uniref:Response regulator receiver sensor signal transduction histidine kinase n=1 Tax=Candidatus Magnetoglobus multicellularis str. Araruama TaxID=890399 RepID=A0A1V1PCD2_9BACT|nr:MAG: Response regulator receiver sensor signal transduction histidine kinase [Candidatus Magnetoglobus multicellularis str. Araruama]